jgi:hypothetical protein
VHLVGLAGNRTVRAWDSGRARLEQGILARMTIPITPSPPLHHPGTSSFSARLAGKSSTMRLLVEGLLAGGKPVCIIDPKGDRWGTESCLR